MKCKFMFRGKALEVRNRHFSGDVGKILAIDRILPAASQLREGWVRQALV